MTDEADTGAAPPPAALDDETAGLPPVLSADPPEAAIPADGGVSTHQLANPSAVRLAFKLKSSNNNNYSLNPVYGFVEATAATPIEITRTAGPPRIDKLVVQFKEAPVDAANTLAIFKEGAPLGEMTIPLNAS